MRRQRGGNARDGRQQSRAVDRSVPLSARSACPVWPRLARVITASVITPTAPTAQA